MSNICYEVHENKNVQENKNETGDNEEVITKDVSDVMENKETWEAKENVSGNKPNDEKEPVEIVEPTNELNKDDYLENTKDAIAYSREKENSEGNKNISTETTVTEEWKKHHSNLETVENEHETNNFTQECKIEEEDSCEKREMENCDNYESEDPRKKTDHQDICSKITKSNSNDQTSDNNDKIEDDRSTSVENAILSDLGKESHDLPTVYENIVFSEHQIVNSDKKALEDESTCKVMNVDNQKEESKTNELCEKRQDDSKKDSSSIIEKSEFESYDEVNEGCKKAAAITEVDMPSESSNLQESTHTDLKDDTNNNENGISSNIWKEEQINEDTINKFHLATNCIMVQEAAEDYETATQYEIASHVESDENDGVAGSIPKKMSITNSTTVKSIAPSDGNMETVMAPGIASDQIVETECIQKCEEDIHECDKTDRSGKANNVSDTLSTSSQDVNFQPPYTSQENQNDPGVEKSAEQAMPENGTPIKSNTHETVENINILEDSSNSVETVCSLSKTNFEEEKRKDVTNSTEEIPSDSEATILVENKQKEIGTEETPSSFKGEDLQITKNQMFQKDHSFSQTSDCSHQEIPSTSPKSDQTISPTEDVRNIETVSRFQDLKETLCNTVAGVTEQRQLEQNPNECVTYITQTSYDVKQDIVFSGREESTVTTEKRDFDNKPEYKVINVPEGDSIPQSEDITTVTKSHEESLVKRKELEDSDTNESITTVTKKSEFATTTNDGKQENKDSSKVLSANVTSDMSISSDLVQNSPVKTTKKVTTFVTTIRSDVPLDIETLRNMGILGDDSLSGSTSQTVFSTTSTSEKASAQTPCEAEKPTDSFDTSGLGVTHSSHVSQDSGVMSESSAEKILEEVVEEDDANATLKSWGKPLGMPTPSMSVKSASKDDSIAKETKASRESKKPSFSPVYLDLAYVPQHGDARYVSKDFFLRVRARYYVFSGVDPSREVFQALLDAKKEWGEKGAEVTIIPTYDTDALGYWVADKEEELISNNIDLAPAASRCTINLQDHETSCAAYRLEF